MNHLAKTIKLPDEAIKSTAVVEPPPDHNQGAPMNHLARTVKLPEQPKPTTDAAPSAVHNQGWLVSLGGPGIPSGSISTLSGHTLIGSAEECDIRISYDATVSRHHAAIILRPDNMYYIKILKPTNPARLNGAVLELSELRRLIDGDEITFGSSNFCFKDLV